MTLADTTTCAYYATKLLGHPVTPDNIRHWAKRHPDGLPKRGTRGRCVLYALEDIEELLKQRQRLHPRSQP